MKKIKIKIEGMSSLRCATDVQRHLSAVPTVKDLRVSIGEAIVQHENATDEQLLRAVRAAGEFTAKLDEEPRKPRTGGRRKWFNRKGRPGS